MGREGGGEEEGRGGGGEEGVTGRGRGGDENPTGGECLPTEGGRGGRKRGEGEEGGRGGRERVKSHDIITLTTLTSITDNAVGWSLLSLHY